MKMKSAYVTQLGEEIKIDFENKVVYHIFKDSTVAAQIILEDKILNFRNILEAQIEIQNIFDKYLLQELTR
jgi:hypothetical protein